MTRRLDHAKASGAAKVRQSGGEPFWLELSDPTPAPKSPKKRTPRQGSAPTDVASSAAAEARPTRENRGKSKKKLLPPAEESKPGKKQPAEPLAKEVRRWLAKIPEGKAALFLSVSDASAVRKALQDSGQSGRRMANELARQAQTEQPAPSDDRRSFFTLSASDARQLWPVIKAAKMPEAQAQRLLKKVTVVHDMARRSQFEGIRPSSEPSPRGRARHITGRPRNQ